MNKNDYYLVLRDYLTNQFEFISIDKNSRLSLEKIDTFTISFNNKKDLYDYLMKNHLIEKDYTHLDFFIVARGKDLFIQEVLFSKNKKLKNIMDASLEGNILKEEESIKSILNSFSRRMEIDQDFYNSIIYHNQSIYPKFISYYVGNRYLDTYSLKYKDGGWVLKSYPLIRNIEESLKRNNLDNNYLLGRDKIDKQLRMMSSKSYEKEQLLLFDFINDTSFENSLEQGEGNGYRRIN